MVQIDAGILYVVATPIGNLGDISQRALTILSTVDCVAAEDTRHSKRLLAHFNIAKPLVSLHDYNEQQRSGLLLQKLQQGESAALISDAGTPLISDPGYHLVQKISAAGITIVPIPGACALISALSASGLPTDRFVFEGFLPAKSVARSKRLEQLATEERTLIFYESPHRLLSTLTAMQQQLGDNRYAVLAKELTKKFETIRGGCLPELIDWLCEDSARQKGEFVILLHGVAKPNKQELDDASLRVLKILAAELPHKQAAALTAQITGKSKNQLYQALTMLS